MKKFTFTFLFIAGVLAASPVQTTTAVYLSSANSVFSPYTMSIYGKTTPALCIDIDDSSNVGPQYAWNAYVTNVSASNLSHTYQGSIDESKNYQTSRTEYEEEAYIFSQITKPGISGDAQADLQVAAWYITAPKFSDDLNTFITDSNAAKNSYWEQQPYYQDFLNIKTDYLDAVASVGNMNYSYYQIVSDQNIDNCNRNQEFMIDATPEPATYALFGLALIITGAVRQLARRKAAANQ